MKISICIPQYNRINYLLNSLERISHQNYDNIEIVISDDCSIDDTESQINKIKLFYKFPIVYQKNSVNKGYDFNYRNCISLASGDYAIVIGNDDSIFGNNSISFLVNFLIKNDYPDIGYCNMIEESSGGTLINRALTTKIIGTGVDIALKNYSCFSFVGGLIYKKATFDKYNTSVYDGSIYAQMYLGVFMINSGAKLFSINEPLVLKDIVLSNEHRNSYKDTIAKKWKDYKVVDGGLPSVINVLISALKDSNQLNQKRVYSIYKRIYSITYPHWILDYKQNGALPEAFGLSVGMYPLKTKNFHLLSLISRIKILILYYILTLFSLLFPVFIYIKIKQNIYSLLKK
jgi:glycosyltransferase involved in cell wall biosynthesis